jgi:cytochrome c-type biogenesis protein CcmH
MSGILAGWALLLALAAAALLPLAFTLWRAPVPRGRKAAALALHRTQLQELDRDRAEGRIGEAEHAAAVLEVQRRALATHEDEAVRRGPVAPVVAALTLVPALALLLYLVGGTPGMPDMPMRERLAAEHSRAAEAAQMEGALRVALARAAPGSEQARQGQVFLGGLLEQQGRFADAAQAWNAALAIRFDPALAARAAEAETSAAGRVTPAAAALFRLALAALPPDSPWRRLAELRLSEVPPG